VLGLSPAGIANGGFPKTLLRWPWMMGRKLATFGPLVRGRILPWHHRGLAGRSISPAM